MMIKQKCLEYIWKTTHDFSNSIQYLEFGWLFFGSVEGSMEHFPSYIFFLDNVVWNSVLHTTDLHYICTLITVRQ